MDSQISNNDQCQAMSEIDPDLIGFAEADTISQRLIFLRKIMAGKKLKHFSKSLEFARGVDAMLRAAKTIDDGQSRLAALDGLIRIWNSSLPASITRQIEEGVAEALVVELPPLAIISDGMDSTFDKPAESRFNIVIALRLTNQDWMRDYRISSILAEDRAPKVRFELVEQALKESTSLESLLLELARRVSAANARSAPDVTSGVRRLRDLVQTIREAQQKVDVEPGDRFGAALEILVDSFLGSSGPHSLGADTTSLAQELLLFNLVGVRARLTLLLDPTSFKAAKIVCDWWGKIPRPLELNHALGLITNRLEEAILVLTRMGQRSAGLVSIYIAVVGAESDARNRLSSFLGAYAGLPTEIVQWLSTGISVNARTDDTRGTPISEALEAEADLTIAALLIDADDILAPLIHLSNNNEHPSVKAILARAERLARDLIALGRDRGLRLRGRNGEEVEFNPIVHEPIGATPTEPIVQIVKPGVVRAQFGGAERVIIRARIDVKR